jgi:hypothetical protein
MYRVRWHPASIWHQSQVELRYRDEANFYAMRLIRHGNTHVYIEPPNRAQ